MPKPWAKYEVDYINHDKFKALSANAICLWVEGKNYADAKLTDGLLPLAVVKQFRFYSAKAVTLLTTSCGAKSAGVDSTRYAPLWESIAGVGWKMHDYLDHNDCRDVVIQRRFEQQVKAAAEKAAKAERMKRWREAKDAKAAAETVPETPQETPEKRLRERHIEKRDALYQKSEVSIQKELREEPPPPTARSKRIIFPGQRVKVFEWMLDELSGLLGPHLDAFDLHRWFYDLDARCLTDGTIPPDRDSGAWLKAQTLAEAQRRGLPLKLATAATEADEWAAIIAKGPSVRP